MNCLDTNILIHAYRNDMPWHHESKEFLEKINFLNLRIAIPYHCFVEFLAIITNPKIFKTPTPIDKARNQLRTLVESDFIILRETENSLMNLMELIAKSRVYGSMIHDARIASTCLENGINTIYTFDRDFNRFVDMKTKNILHQ